MIDLQRLYQEIQKYSGLSDKEIVDRLNEPIITRRNVPTGEIIGFAFNIGLYPKLVALGLDETQPIELRAFATTLTDLKSQAIANIDPTTPAAQKMLTGLVQYGLITIEEAAEFEALGIVNQTTLALRAGLGEPTVDDIVAAREWAKREEVLQPLRNRLDVAYYQAQQLLTGETVPKWVEIIKIFEDAA